jgi:hypothetical protein
MFSPEAVNMAVWLTFAKSCMSRLVALKYRLYNSLITFLEKEIVSMTPQTRETTASVYQISPFHSRKYSTSLHIPIKDPCNGYRSKAVG